MPTPVTSWSKHQMRHHATSSGAESLGVQSKPRDRRLWRAPFGTGPCATEWRCSISFYATGIGLISSSHVHTTLFYLVRDRGMGAVSDALERWRAAERRLRDVEQSRTTELEIVEARLECEAARRAYQHAFEKLTSRTRSRFMRTEARGRSARSTLASGRSRCRARVRVAGSGLDFKERVVGSGEPFRARTFGLLVDQPANRRSLVDQLRRVFRHRPPSVRFNRNARQNAPVQPITAPLQPVEL